MPIERLPEVASIRSAFQVTRILEVVTKDHGLGGLALKQRTLQQPFLKDYDAADGGPLTWRDRFDVANWALLSAVDVGEWAGTVVIAASTPELTLLGGRSDVAVIWDIRVRGERRGQGVGSALMRAAEEWAQNHAYSVLEVETQSINVPACKLYARCGFHLGAINRFAYPEDLEEVQLIWYKVLRSP